MKKFIIDNTIDVGGTHLIGYINCSFADLFKIFGKPNGFDAMIDGQENSDGKVSTEWFIKNTEMNEIFTIYDYKEYLYFPEDIENFRSYPEYQWHIGGKNKNDETIKELIDFIKIESGKIILN